MPFALRRVITSLHGLHVWSTHVNCFIRTQCEHNITGGYTTPTTGAQQRRWRLSDDSIKNNWFSCLMVLNMVCSWAGDSCHPPSPPPHDDKVSSCTTLYVHFWNIDIICITRANITYLWFAETMTMTFSSGHRYEHRVSKDVWIFFRNLRVKCRNKFFPDTHAAFVWKELWLRLMLHI